MPRPALKAFERCGRGTAAVDLYEWLAESRQARGMSIVVPPVVQDRAGQASGHGEHDFVGCPTQSCPPVPVAHPERVEQRFENDILVDQRSLERLSESSCDRALACAGQSGDHDEPSVEHSRILADRWTSWRGETPDQPEHHRRVELPERELVATPTVSEAGPALRGFCDRLMHHRCQRGAEGGPSADGGEWQRTRPSRTRLRSTAVICWRCSPRVPMPGSGTRGVEGSLRCIDNRPKRLHHTRPPHDGSPPRSRPCHARPAP